MFVAYDIDVQEMTAAVADEIGGAVGRGFPVSGGVRRAVADALQHTFPVETAAVDGLDRDALRLLRRIAASPEKASVRPDGARFLEVMACSGGCVGGPLAYGSARTAARAIAKEAASHTAAGTGS